MSETTLGALAQSGVLSLGDGYRTKQSELTESGFRIIRVADVRDGRISLDSPDFVSADFERQIGAKRAAAGDVLLTTKGTVGRVAIVPTSVEPAVYSPQLCWFRVIDPTVIEYRFLAYWLQSDAFLAQSSYMQGNTDMAPYISLSDLRSSKITLPPLAEQHAIAEVLGALDDKIAANTALAFRLSELLEADYLVVARTATRTVPLSSLVSTQYGVTTSAVPGTQGTGLVRVTDINKRPWIEWDGVPGCVLDELDRQKYLLHPGDIVVARMADPGKAGWVSAGDPPAVFASYLVRLRAHEPSHAPFIYQFLRSPEYLRYSDGAMQGSVQKNMNAKVIVATDLPQPDGDKLRDFALRFDQSWALMASHLRENRTLTATRDALLPQLMSGKLRVRDAEDLIVQAGL